MTPQEAIDYIENYSWSSTRLGLDRTRELLHLMGDPQQRLKFVHVAGSNGKGSTCAMLSSVLQNAHLRTGLYTSPYIQAFNERMQIDGDPIPGEELARITAQVRQLADKMPDHPSQFELVTAIALQYFADARCDIVVLEVGMGGRLDATNVIGAPEAAIITNIGLEHTEYLGETLTEIAMHKGGIIKPGCTAVCYECGGEVMRALRGICAELGVPLRSCPEEDLVPLSHDLDGQRFKWKGTEYFIPLIGRHQLRNAGVVLETVSVLRERGWNIPESAVRGGLRAVRWPARFEVLSREPLFILDGGHNPQCAEAMAANIRDYLPDDKLCFLIGVLRDKDYPQMLDLIAPFAASFICVTPDSPRALPGQELAAWLLGRGFAAEYAEDIPCALEKALNSGRNVVAFGSLYMAGLVRTHFPKCIKTFQRSRALSRRNALSAAQREVKSTALCRNILSSPYYENAGTIMLFKAFRSEASLAALEAQAVKDGKRLLYPRCLPGHKLLALRPLVGEAWEKDGYGISVPLTERSEAVSPEDIDLVICPCSAFDREGRRLGMGGGYYDRFLPLCKNAAFVLAAFAEQELSRVYTDEHDMRMDAVATDKEIKEIISVK